MNIYPKEGGKEEISNKGVVSQAEIINNHLLFSTVQEPMQKNYGLPMEKPTVVCKRMINTKLTFLNFL